MEVKPGKNRKHEVTVESPLEAASLQLGLVRGPRQSFAHMIAFTLRDRGVFSDLADIAQAETYPATVEMTDRQLRNVYTSLLIYDVIKSKDAYTKYVANGMLDAIGPHIVQAPEIS